MTHVQVNHLVVLVRPNDGIVPTVPDLVRLWAGAERKAGRVYREQNVDVGILPQILFPAVPLTGRGPKRLGQMGSRRMLAVFDTENGRGRPPRVAYIRPCPEKRVVIPVPVCGVHRRGQRKTGKMKPHPRPTMLHVRPERTALYGVLRTRIEKNHDLILRKKVRVQIAPMGRGVIAEIVFRRHLRKPYLGFTQETDMRRIFLAGEERDHAKLWLDVSDAGAPLT